MAQDNFKTPPDPQKGPWNHQKSAKKIYSRAGQVPLVGGVFVAILQPEAAKTALQELLACASHQQHLAYASPPTSAEPFALLSNTPPKRIHQTWPRKISKI